VIKRRETGFQTKAIHAGQEPEPATGAVVVPIYQTSTFAQQAPGVHRGFEYSRSANPTRSALETCLASLEKGRQGLCFASGLAAGDAVLSLLQAGDHVVAMDDMYGGTFRLFEKVWRKRALDFSYVDLSRSEALDGALTADTKLLWIETPTNPLLRLVDIEDLSAKAHERGLLVAVDNTFATPYLQNPLELGADIVVHSTTKYLGGHSDVVGGALVVRDSGLGERLAFVQNAAGAVAGPFDAWLTLRGVKTLGVRMDRHCDNALAVANFLESHPRVRSVRYPGLDSHPQKALAEKQMQGFGGMVTAILDGGIDASRRFLASLRVFTLAESLGGVESLAEHPAIMTHASLPVERRRALGIEDGLVRLSVGIEDEADLIRDLEQALQAAFS